MPEPASQAVRVRLPTHLHDYTGGRAELTLELEPPVRLDQVLRALDARWPGMRFRLIDEQDGIRRHIRLFVGGRSASAVSEPVPAEAEVMIVAALSGG